MTAETDPDPEDAIGVAFSSFLTAVLIAVMLYGLMLVLLTLAHNSRRAEEIGIRNDDDARDVRYKRRKREGLPDDFFLKFGYRYGGRIPHFLCIYFLGDHALFLFFVSKLRLGICVQSARRMG
jgi:hypothetical protein